MSRQTQPPTPPTRTRKNGPVKGSKHVKGPFVPDNNNEALRNTQTYRLLTSPEAPVTQAHILALLQDLNPNNEVAFNLKDAIILSKDNYKISEVKKILGIECVTSTAIEWAKKGIWKMEYREEGHKWYMTAEELHKMLTAKGRKAYIAGTDNIY